MKKIKLFLDDERCPVGEDWIIARSFYEAVGVCVYYGLDRVEMISFDHDLGRSHSGMDFVIWLCRVDMDGDFGNLSPDFKYEIHSQNPIGAANMRSYLESYLKHAEDLRE